MSTDDMKKRAAGSQTCVRQGVRVVGHTERALAADVLALISEVERLTKANEAWESERRRIEAALDTTGLHDAENTLTSRVERTCAEVVKGRRIDKQLQAFLDLHESDFAVLRGARPSPLVRIEKLVNERDKLKAEVELLHDVMAPSEKAAASKLETERVKFKTGIEQLCAEESGVIRITHEEARAITRFIRGAGYYGPAKYGDIEERLSAALAAADEAARLTEERDAAQDALKLVVAREDAKLREVHAAGHQGARDEILEQAAR